MMNEILSEVSQKTGLSPEQTEQAVTAVLGVLKSHLPAPLAEAMSSFIGTGAAGTGTPGATPGTGGVEEMIEQGIAAKAMSALGGLFGSKS